MKQKKLILDRSILRNPLRNGLHDRDFWNITSIISNMGIEPEWVHFPNKESVLLHDEPILLGQDGIKNAFMNKEYGDFDDWLGKFYRKHNSMNVISTIELFHPRHLGILKAIDSYGKSCRVLAPWTYRSFKNIKLYISDLNINTIKPHEFKSSSTLDNNFFALLRTTIKQDRDGRKRLVENLRARNEDSKFFSLHHEFAIEGKDRIRYIEERMKGNWDIRVPHDLYERCQLEIVCETNSTIHEVFYPTEKIYKPLSAGIPFVVLANKGFLKGLRGKGFRTFGEIFDESYDDIENLSDRVDAISELVKSIKNKDLKRSCRDITRHNRKRFYEIYSKSQILYVKKLKKIVNYIFS